MGLIEHITNPEELKGWYGDIPIENQYTVGPATERFLREIKDHGRFVGTRCTRCNLLYLPPRLYCERCFSELTDWQQVPNHGHVHSFTVVHVDLEGKPLAEPQILAIVHMDGTHGGIIHRLANLRPETVQIGMTVEAFFKEKRRREGSILDIQYFRPASSL